MKAKVIKSFKDKGKGTVYQVDEIITVNKKRYEEINSTAFGILIEEVKEQKESG